MEAYIDGREVKLKQANIMFSGIQVSSGNHRVELRYRTPWLVPGILISIVGFILFGLITAFERSNLSKQTRHEKQEHSESHV